MKKSKPFRPSHTSASKIGAGDYQGQAVRQKIGRAISIMTETPAKSRKMKPPKSLA